MVRVTVRATVSFSVCVKVSVRFTVRVMELWLQLRLGLRFFFTHFTHSGMWACLCLKKEEKKRGKNYILIYKMMFYYQ